MKYRSTMGRGGGLVNGVADSGPGDPSLIPHDEKKENKQKEARVGSYLKKCGSTGSGAKEF